MSISENGGDGVKKIPLPWMGRGEFTARKSQTSS
jgi:hypothetical protein